MSVKKDKEKVRVKKDQEKRNKILPSKSKEGKFMKIFKTAEFWKIFILYFIFHILYYGTQHLKQKSFEDMLLSIRDYTIIKVVQDSHHQGDVRYGASRGIQCSCMLLISVSWTLLKPPGLWNKFDLDCILGKGNQLFRFIGKFRYFGVEDLPQEFMIANCPINVELLESKTGEITAVAYLLSIAEIVKSARQTGTRALLIVILGLIWGTDSIYLFDSHSTDEYGNLLSSGTVVLLKFDFLNSLENYIRSVYYNTFP